MGRRKMMIKVPSNLLDKRISRLLIKMLKQMKTWKYFFESNTGASELQVIQERLAAGLFHFISVCNCGEVFKKTLCSLKKIVIDA